MPQLKQTQIRHKTFSGATTSGIEHAHNSQGWLFPRRRGRLRTLAENAEMRLVFDYKECEEQLVIDTARSLWTKLYTGHRHYTKAKRTKGIATGPRTGNTLVNFDRARESGVRRCLKEHTAPSSLRDLQWDAAVNSASVWADTMTAELNFNDNKQSANKLQALRNGTLLPQEFSEQNIDEAVTGLEHKRKLRKVSY